MLYHHNCEGGSTPARATLSQWLENKRKDRDKEKEV